MDKLKMHTPDMTQDNIARIRELFPNCVTEAKDRNGNISLAVDFDALRQELSNSIVEGERERYRLDWPGKKEAMLAANAPIAKTLRPCREESVDFDTTQNLFIEGDNLDALKLLQESYLGKVKMIYIDPPYNTGNDFIYKDDFAENTDEYLERSSQKDKSGRLVANTESNGRFHSDWLSMMYPRLKLARNLLSDDGAIFVSCDDSEQENLKKVCDEIFGQENYLVTFYIQVRFADKTLSEKNNYQKIVEHVLVYHKGTYTPIKEKEEYSVDKFCFHIEELKPGKEAIIGGKKVQIFEPNEYTITTVKPSLEGLKETWATGSVLKVNASGKFFGLYLAPRKTIDGLGMLYKVYGIGEDGLGYRYFTGPQRETASKGKFFSGVPLERRKELENGISLKEKPIINFYNFSEAFGNCRHEGNIDFRGGKKPLEFLTMLIRQSVYTDEHAIILDFFAGSSSTAHAVMQLNAEDGGNRRFIMVQLPEVCDEKSEAAKAGYKTIAEISKERIRRAGKKIKEELAAKQTSASSTGQMSLLDAAKPAASSLDIGFRVLKVDSSNMNDVFYNPDAVTQKTLMEVVSSIKYDRSDEDLLFQVLLDWGVELSLSVRRETMQGKTVFFVDENALVACFDKNITEELVQELAKLQPVRAVFRDDGFASDAVKINVEQIFRLLSPGTLVKTL